MRKRSIILLISLVLSFSVSAQRKLKQLDEEEASKKEALEKADRKGIFNKEKWTFGGNAGGGFAAGGGFFFAQPVAGYKLTEKTIVGPGATYMYQGIGKYSLHVYGPVLFARHQLFSELFAHMQYQPLNKPLYYNAPGRVWEQVLFVGGGYGGNSGVYVSALYNVLWESNKSTSLYGSPYQINIGIFF